MRLDPVAMDAIAFAAPVRCTLTGAIRSADVLVGIFLWLRPDQRDLLAISQVSVGWRACSANLPQWCIVPQLLHPELRAANFVDPDRHGVATFYGYNVENRDGYLKTMATRTRIKKYAAVLARGPRASCCLESRCFLFVQALSVSALLAGIFACAYAIGQSGVTKATLNSDGEVGALCFFLTLALLLLTPVVLWGVRALLRPNSNHELNLHQRGEVPWLIATAIAAIMLSTVVGLLSARVGMARYLAERTWHYSDGVCPAGSEPPRYVLLDAIGNWTLQPNSTTVCAAPTNAVAAQFFGARWWADQYVNSGLTSGNSSLAIGYGSMPMSDLTPSWAAGNPCADVFTTSGGESYRYVTMRPPAWWKGCSASVAVALVYDAQSAEFNATVLNVFSGRAVAQASTTTAVFRTPVSSPWLGVSWTLFGDAWYGQAAPSSAWVTRGVALAVAPSLGASPWDVAASWEWTLATWFIVAACFMAATFLLLALPRSCIRNRDVVYCCMFVAILLANPLWLVAWGLRCFFAFDETDCLMSAWTAFMLLVVGSILSFGRRSRSCSAEALLAEPYFTNSDLPDSAESADAFQDALREAFKSRQQSVSSMTVS